jgi:hypothetical protein
MEDYDEISGPKSSDSISSTQLKFATRRKRVVAKPAALVVTVVDIRFHHVGLAQALESVNTEREGSI